MNALPQSDVPEVAELRAGLGDIAGVVRASRLGERPAPAMVSTGIAELDALTGGLPRGALTEICGPASSGRTSVLLSVMAQMTRAGEVCALVDAGDCFDPYSAQAAGVELPRMLWVRCNKNHTQRRRDVENIADCRLPIVDCVQRVGGSKKSGASHCTSTSDHQRSAIDHRLSPVRQSAMPLLEQALKATDLLLQGGGFGLLVVDLADIPPAAARRVPLTSWFRFRRAVENTSTVLLVLEQEPYAKTCASVVLALSRQSSVISRQPAKQQSAISMQQSAASVPPHAQILSGLHVHVEVVHDRNQQKKPVRSAGAQQFASRTEWAVSL